MSAVCIETASAGYCAFRSHQEPGGSLMKPQHPVMSRLTRDNYSGLCYRNDISEHQGWVNLVFIVYNHLYPEIRKVSCFSEP